MFVRWNCTSNDDLNSVSLIAAGFDVKEFANEIDLNASRNDNNKDLNKRPGSDITVVLLEQRKVSGFNSSRMRLELVPTKKAFDHL